MEGEKETSEEKGEEEEEDYKPHHYIAATSVEYPDLPIMHWEDLSQRIAELEKQELERRERSKKCGTGESPVGVWSDIWEEEEEDSRRCRVVTVASRFHNHRNLQLCFINNSESEDEEEATKKVSLRAGGNGGHASGLKKEVIIALRTLRDKVLAEQKEEHLASCSVVTKRKHLERRELQECTEKQLNSLRVTIQQEVHALSSELVAHLLVRDQLRTKQDAMLLDVQDLT